MAGGEKIGTMIAEINLDSSKYDAGLLKALENSKGTTTNVEKAWRTMGTRSADAVDKMRANVINSYNAIKNSATSTASDIERAETYAKARLEKINKRFYGNTVSQIKEVEAAAKSNISTFNILEKAMGGLALGYMVKQLGEQADKWKLVEARLSLVTAGTNELVSAQASLFEMSQKTRVSYESTGDLYARIARSTKEMKLSQQDMLGVTETINKALIISGASAASADAALMQLGQGLAAGALRGEEFNSVVEQTPRLAEAIADSLGVNIGQLRKMAGEGKLTAKVVVDALKQQSDAAKKVDEEFKKMPVTIGQGSVQIKNSLLKTIGELDKTTGASEAVAEVLTTISENMDIAATSAGILAATALPATLLSVTSAATRAAGAVGLLNVALLTNPVTAAVTAFAGFTATMYALYKTTTDIQKDTSIEGVALKIKLLEDHIKDLEKTAVKSGSEIQKGLLNSFGGGRNPISGTTIDAAANATNESLSTAKKALVEMKEHYFRLIDTINDTPIVPDSSGQNIKKWESYEKQFQSTINNTIEAKQKELNAYRASENAKPEIVAGAEAEIQAMRDKAHNAYLRMIEAQKKAHAEKVRANLASIPQLTEVEMIGLEARTDAEREAYEESVKIEQDRLESIKKSMEEEQEVREEAYADFSDTIQENTADILRDWDNAWETMTDIMKDALIEMAAEALTSNIIVPVAMDVGSAMGLSWNGVSFSNMTGSSSEAGSILSTGGSLLSSGSSLWNAYSGATSGAVYSGASALGIGQAGAELGWGAAAAADVGIGSTAASSLVSGIATAAPYIAAAYALYEIGSSLFGDDPNPLIKMGSSTGGFKSDWGYGINPDDMGNQDEIAPELINYFDNYFQAIDDEVALSLKDVLSNADFRTVADLSDFDTNAEAFAAMTNDIFKDIRSSLIESMGLSAETFDQSFFESLAGEGGDWFAAFIGFEDMATSFSDFEARINEQIGEGLSLESAYANLYLISDMLELATTSVENMASSSTITTLEDIVDMYDVYIQSMEDAMATQAEVTQIQNALYQEIGSSVSGLAADSFQTAMIEAAESGGTVTESIKSMLNQSMAQAVAASASEAIFAAFLAPINKQIGEAVVESMVNGAIDGAILGASVAGIIADVDWEEIEASISGAMEAINLYTPALEMVYASTDNYTSTYDSSVDDAEQLAESLEEFLDGLDDILAKYSNSDITQQYQDVIDWKETQIATADELLTDASELINDAYKLQINDLVTSVFDDFVTPVIENFASTMFTPFESALADIDMSSKQAVSSLDELAGLLSADDLFKDSIDSFNTYKNQLIDVIEAIAYVQKLQLTSDYMSSLASAQAGVMGLGSEYELMRLSSTYGLDLGSYDSQKTTVDNLSTASFADFLAISTKLNIPIETIISDMQSLADIVRETEDTFDGLVETIADYRSGLLISDDSTLSNELKTTLARANFLDVYAASMSSDPEVAAEAMAELPGAATAMLDLSKNTSSSMYEYNKDMSLVLRSLEDAEEYAESYTKTGAGTLTEAEKQTQELMHLAGMAASISLIDTSIQELWENADVQAFFSSFDATFGSGIFTALDESLSGLQGTLSTFSGVTASQKLISTTLPELNSTLIGLLGLSSTIPQLDITLSGLVGIGSTLSTVDSTLLGFLGIESILPEISTTLDGFSDIFDTQDGINAALPLLASSIISLEATIAAIEWYNTMGTTSSGTTSSGTTSSGTTSGVTTSGVTTSGGIVIDGIAYSPDDVVTAIAGSSYSSIMKAMADYDLDYSDLTTIGGNSSWGGENWSSGDIEKYIKSKALSDWNNLTPDQVVNYVTTTPTSDLLLSMAANGISYDDLAAMSNQTGPGYSWTGSDIEDYLSTRGFADGGTVFSPMLAMLGEGGQAEHITPDSQMKGVKEALKDVIEELKALRLDNKMLMKENNMYSKKLHTIMRTKQSEDGTAFVTEAA